MKLIIGTDEAGYGPNLGPLVVTASSWLIPESCFQRPGDTLAEAAVPREPRPTPPPNKTSPQSPSPTSHTSPDLYRTFHSLFGRLGEGERDKILVGDSKEAFKSGAGLSNLELAVLPIWLGSCLAESPHDEFLRWDALVASLLPPLLVADDAADSPGRIDLPWYRDFNPELPIDAERDRLQAQTKRLEEFLNRKSIGCRHRTRMVEPGPFNRLCDQLGNKATLLSQVTLSLVFQSVSEFFTVDRAEPITEVHVLCDKHGGRNSYAGIIQSFFTESWVQVVSEGRQLSRYSLTCNDCPVYFDFVAKGEQHLPIGIASMFSKYVRELCMLAFNRFWLEKIEALSPTAGYPVDAKRFRREIEPLANKLDLSASEWWRNR